jgi:hypothetical protein
MVSREANTQIKASRVPDTVELNGLDFQVVGAVYDTNRNFEDGGDGLFYTTRSKCMEGLDLETIVAQRSINRVL